MKACLKLYYYENNPQQIFVQYVFFYVLAVQVKNKVFNTIVKPIHEKQTCRKTHNYA